MCIFHVVFARMPSDTSSKPLPRASPFTRPVSGAFLEGGGGGTLAKRPIRGGGGADWISLPFSSGAGAGGDAGCNFHTQLRAKPLWHR